MLTDSAKASSSPSLGFLCFLCCFLDAWLFLAEVNTVLELELDRLLVDSKLGDRVCCCCCGTGEYEDEVFSFPPSDAFGCVEVMTVVDKFGIVNQEDACDSTSCRSTGNATAAEILANKCS
jgi:hypothetical protein